MADGLAGGLVQEGTFTPIQLWAGEPNGQTTQGTAEAGHVFGEKNSRGETSKFAVVTLSLGGLLIPWNPLADYADALTYASGTLTIANAVPAADDKFTINGVDIVFKVAADPDEFEVTIGGTITATMASLATFINDHRSEFDIDGGVTATANVGVVTVRSPGVAGNAVTLAKTFATGANGSVSGATLAGGTDDVAGVIKPYGILPHYLDTTAEGYNAAVDTPVFISGHPNFEALALPDGTTYAEIKQAFAGSMINVQRLY